MPTQAGSKRPKRKSFRASHLSQDLTIRLEMSQLLGQVRLCVGSEARRDSSVDNARATKSMAWNPGRYDRGLQARAADSRRKACILHLHSATRILLRIELGRRASRIRETSELLGADGRRFEKRAQGVSGNCPLLALASASHRTSRRRKSATNGDGPARAKRGSTIVIRPGRTFERVFVTACSAHQQSQPKGATKAQQPSSPAGTWTWHHRPPGRRIVVCWFSGNLNRRRGITSAPAEHGNPTGRGRASFGPVAVMMSASGGSPASMAWPPSYS
ncbi:hypothetical protein Purlil1_3576 [Purpureocillium lilacinum]|uniref:Uncharacterized protein n=1 Tax=Purpureocillium lilacinum TaxID=33203 RepID=A0ABR0C7G1_PURLI|nr:hypothetical protein Purlil1_3576 [Purpureocillium lilacinum]